MWSRKFEEPIKLVDGRKLNTLRDAGYYIINLPPEAVSLPHWRFAMEALSQVTESSPTTQARVAFLRALKDDAPHLFRTRAFDAPLETNDISDQATPDRGYTSRRVWKSAMRSL